MVNFSEYDIIIIDVFWIKEIEEQYSTFNYRFPARHLIHLLSCFNGEDEENQILWEFLDYFLQAERLSENDLEIIDDGVTTITLKYLDQLHQILNIHDEDFILAYWINAYTLALRRKNNFNDDLLQVFEQDPFSSFMNHLFVQHNIKRTSPNL